MGHLEEGCHHFWSNRDPKVASNDLCKTYRVLFIRRQTDAQEFRVHRSDIVVIDGLDLVTENLLKVTNRLPVVRARDRPPEIYHQRIDFGLICRVIGAAAEQRSLVCQIITHDWL